MNYRDINDATELSVFLVEDLSDETCLSIYKERQEHMFDTGYESRDPRELLGEYVQNLFYTAAFNMISSAMKNGIIDEEQADQLY